MWLEKVTARTLAFHHQSRCTTTSFALLSWKCFCCSNVWRILTNFWCGFDILIFFLSVQKKIKACHLFRNLSVYCLVRPIRLVMQDSLAGPFFHRALFPSSSPALFLLSFLAQILGRCRNILSVLLWNKGLMVLQPSSASVWQVGLSFHQRLPQTSSELCSAYLNTQKRYF